MKTTLVILSLLILTSCQDGVTWVCDGECHNGFGTKKWSDGGIERGTWENGQLIGLGYQFFGTTSEFSGDTYQGEFQDGYDGFGNYYDKSEDALYVGDFKNGKFEGKGKLSFGSKAEYPNRYYEGDWMNGKRHGFGVKFWGDAGKYTNNVYTGEWKDDQMHGTGRYDWDEGSYIGPWLNDTQHGEGMFIFENGDTLLAEWDEGYCRELALRLYGASESTFRTLIKKENIPSHEISQRFIDKLKNELSLHDTDPSYKIKFSSLLELVDTALTVNERVISTIEKVEEYDPEIPYKHDFLQSKLALQELLSECEKWIRLNIQKASSTKIEASYLSIFERLEQMKSKREEFELTVEKFRKKHR